MDFGTAASLSVFKNPNLLTDIVPSASPTVIGGVQQGAPGVRIDDVGNFRDLGDVAIGKGDACNVLSACQVVDTERTFKYDDENDKFIHCLRPERGLRICPLSTTRRQQDAILYSRFRERSYGG